MKNILVFAFQLVLAFSSTMAQHRTPAVGRTAPPGQAGADMPRQAIFSALSDYYFEGFESNFPPAGWQVVDVLDTATGWNSSLTADFPAAYQGTSSAYCRYEFASPSSGESWLITPAFQVASGDSLTFRFKLEYFGFAPDSTFILVSTSDSALTSFTDQMDFYAEGLNYPADSSNWYYKTYSLDAYAGQTIYVAFKNKNDEGDGIFIDNVELGTRPAAEAGIVSVDVDDFIPTGLSTPLVTVANNGATAQTFNVTLDISDGYSDTQPITLSPLSSGTVSFANWNAAIGTFTLSARTSLTGDANPANDTASKITKVLEPFEHYGWSIHDPLVDPTFGSAVASVHFGSSSRLFLLGGYGQLTILPDAYEYDLGFNSWTSIAPMPVECTYASSATANGKIFVFGGRTLGTAQGSTQIYDYATDTWSTGSPMPTPVITAAYGTYRDSLVYIIGGLIDATGGAVSLVQIYNAYTDTWSSGTTLPGPALYASRAGIVNNKIVVAGGYNPVTGQATASTYVGEINVADPLQVNWTQADDHPAGMLSRGGAATSLDPASGLVVFAGGSPEPSIFTTTDRTFAYDVNSGSWKLGPDKPTARNLFYMTPILYQDSVYLVALGGNPPGTSLNHSDAHEWLNLGRYSLATGIVTMENIAGVSVFPNPFQDGFNVVLELPKPMRCKITLTDVLGRELKVVSDGWLPGGRVTVPVSFPDVPAGLYSCTIQAESNTLYTKVVKY